MPDVFLKRESDAELRFEHSILSGWIFAGIGCALAYFGSLYIEPPFARWMMIGMGWWIVSTLSALGIPCASPSRRSATTYGMMTVTV